MIIYTASTLVNRGDRTDNYPTCATSHTYSSLEAFIDLCELNARKHEWFGISDVLINGMSVQLRHDGNLVKLDTQVRSFKNYRGRL